MTLTREQIAGLRSLLAKADHLSIAGMGQMVHVEREQFRALLDIAEAVANAPLTTMWEAEQDSLETSDLMPDEYRALIGKRVALVVLPLAGEVA